MGFKILHFICWVTGLLIVLLHYEVSAQTMLCGILHEAQKVLQNGKIGFLKSNNNLLKPSKTPTIPFNTFRLKHIFYEKAMEPADLV